MRLPEEPEAPLHINIVPMIDVVFAVLAFFILSSLFLTRGEGLAVSLPSAQTGQVQPPRSVTVTLDAKGALFVDHQPVEAAQMLATVRPLLAPTTSSLVVIQADQSVSHGQVVAVMDQLRTLPGVQLAIATQPQPTLP